MLNHPIKTIGIHDVQIALHPEVETRVSVNVARSEDEATRQAAGEDLTLGRSAMTTSDAPEAAAETADAEEAGEEAASDEAEKPEAAAGE